MEIQKNILGKGDKRRVSQEEFNEILKMVSPGTSLRTALDGIVNYGKGALIVIENEFLQPLIDGGFRVNCRFSFQKLIELSKMDGAIILTRDLKKIVYANALLTPNSKIKSHETGTRHKAAERTGIQIDGLAIAISERKKDITLFYKNKKYTLKNASEILRRANEYIQILERQRELFDNYILRLNQMELRNYINLKYAISSIQKGKIIKKVSEELKRYLIELGEDGVLLKTRLKEILIDVEEETNLIIKDYSNADEKESIEFLNNLSYEELLEKENVLKALNHENVNDLVKIAGWRILSKTDLTELQLKKMIEEETTLQKLISLDISEIPLDMDEGMFASLKIELERMKMSN